MAAILKTRLTEFNTFCREVNIKRNAQPRKLKPGDPETGCSVGSMKRGKRGRAEVSKMGKAEALQQDRRKMRGQCCLCTSTREQWVPDTSAHLHKEKGITVQGVTSLWLTEKRSFHKKGAHHCGIAPAVLIIIFIYGVFPCIVQRNIVLNRILSFHYLPLQLMLCQHLLPWNTDRVVMVLHLTKCQGQQQELHYPYNSRNKGPSKRDDLSAPLNILSRNSGKSWSKPLGKAQGLRNNGKPGVTAFSQLQSTLLIAVL